MQFNYKAITATGEKKEGVVEAVNKDLAISALQRRGLVVASIKAADEAKSFLEIRLLESVPMKDIVMLSRQISTLFEAQVSALKAFSLLGGNTENKLLQKTLNQIVDDIQAGFSISGALAKHPKVFSEFYVNMVKAGEESGKLVQTFSYLADYLDRQYELTSKTRNALIYPAFVIFVFITVMILMFVIVIPKLSQIIIDSGQQIPVYTKVVIGISNFFVNYGLFILIALIAFGGYVWWYSQSDKGKKYLDQVKLSIPFAGNLFTKLYLSRIADNMETMLTSGIPIVRSIEITAAVVGNRVYRDIMLMSADKVKAGSSLADSVDRHIEIPSIMVQMIKVGEETGSVGMVLKTLGKFYKREVDDAVDTLVDLIEPFMIVLLGVGVGILLTSVLVPIYNIASGIS